MLMLLSTRQVRCVYSEMYAHMTTSCNKIVLLEAVGGRLGWGEGRHCPKGQEEGSQWKTVGDNPG